MDEIRLSNDIPPSIFRTEYKVFSPDESHMERKIDFYIMIFMVKGTLYFTEDDVEITLNSNEYYLQNKDVLQSAIRPSPTAEYYFVHFKGCLCKENESGIILPFRMDYDKEYVIPLLKKLTNYSLALPYSFLNASIDFYKLMKYLTGNRKFDEDMVKKTIEYLNNNYTKKITYETLCDTFKYSEAHLKKFFKKATGISAHEYLLDIRLRMVMQRLQSTNRSLVDISVSSGFSDFPSLYRAFKSRMGISPSEYRKLYRK